MRVFIIFFLYFYYCENVEDEGSDNNEFTCDFLDVSLLNIFEEI